MYIVQGEGQLPFWQPLPARALRRVDAALKNTSPPPRARSDTSWIMLQDHFIQRDIRQHGFQSC